MGGASSSEFHDLDRFDDLPLCQRTRRRRSFLVLGSLCIIIAHLPSFCPYHVLLRWVSPSLKSCSTGNDSICDDEKTYPTPPRRLNVSFFASTVFVFGTGGLSKTYVLISEQMYWYHEEDEAKSPIYSRIPTEHYARNDSDIFWFLISTNFCQFLCHADNLLFNASMIFITSSYYRQNLKTNIMWVNLVFYYCHLWSCKDVFLLVLIQQPGAELFTLPKYMFLPSIRPCMSAFCCDVEGIEGGHNSSLL